MGFLELAAEENTTINLHMDCPSYFSRAINISK